MADRVRSTTLNRDTNETKIQLSLNLDGGALEELEESAAANGEPKSHAAQVSKSQTIDVDSGIGFLDHMIHALAKHAGWSLRIRCRGDLHSTLQLYSITPSQAFYALILPSILYSTTILIKLL